MSKTDPDLSPEPVRGETAVAVRQAGGIQLTDWDSLREFAGAVVKSQQYKNWTSAPQVAITIQTGAELGFSPIRSLAAFYTPPGGKVVRRTSRLKAHDEQNDAHTGDLVRVMETRPTSATKRWRLTEILEKAK